MADAQTPGVKTEPGKAEGLAEVAIDAPLSVGSVSEDVVVKVGEMPANLMSATRGDPDLQERQAASRDGQLRKMREALELRTRRPAHAGVSRERTVDLSALRRLAAHEGEVLLASVVGGQDLLESASSFRSERESDGPRGGAIQTVHRVQEAAELRPQLLQQKDAIR